MKDPLDLFHHLFTRKSGLFLAAVILLNLLGAGIAHYLGNSINWLHFIVGLAWLFVLGGGILFLDEIFNPVKYSSANDIKSLTREDQRRRQNTLFTIVAVILSIVAILLVWMLHEMILSIPLIIVILITVILALVLILPPIRLWTSGIGEFLLAVLFCQIIPVYAFFFQADNLNHLLSLSTLPLTAIFFAMLIAFQFESYGKFPERSGALILTRIGWQKGAIAHNLLLAIAYLMIGVAYWAGLPWRIVFPFLFTIPVAVFQIYLMNGITSGAKPQWRLFRYTAGILTLLAIYLITYSYWMI